MIKSKLIALAFVVSLILAACAGGGADPAPAPAPAPAETGAVETPADPAPADAPEGVTITYWYWPDNPDFVELMQGIVRLFNETNESGITVIAEEIPWEGGGYSHTLFTAVMGGGGPDAAALKITSLPLFMNNNLVYDLSGFAAAWQDYDDIDPNMLSIIRGVGDGSLYALPWNVQVLYVYYRPSLMELAGIEVPTTYEELLEAIEALTMDLDGDGITDVYGFGMRGGPGGHEPWGSFVGARGGTLYDLTTPEAIQGMQDFMDVFNNGFAPATAPNDGFAEIIANFQSGRTAMTVHHVGSHVGMVDALGDDVGAFPFPGSTGRWTSMGENQNVVISATEHPEAAFEWLAFLTSGEGQEIWTRGTGVIPVSARVQTMPHFQENPFVRTSILGMPYAGIFPILDTTTEWISAWPHTMAQALFGQITAEEAMQIFQERLWEN